jgi:hypothetical protein
VSLQDLSTADHNDPFKIDTSVAHPARVYDCLLGGQVNFEADRSYVDTMAATFPTVRVTARENRRFLHRVVTYLVKEAGIRQFLDIGTGIPASDNVHEVAQAIDPTARVVYVDNDPIVLAHARRLLATAPGGATAYIHADLRDPDTILDHPDLRATLDLDEPVALLLIAVLHFIQDGDDPHGLVAALTAALATGSYLAISNVTLDFLSPEMRARIEAFNAREHDHTRDPSAPRDHASFSRFFDGMQLIPPGITPICDWRNDAPPDERPPATEVGIYGAVARIR